MLPLLLLLLLLPLPSLSLFHPQDNYLLTFTSSSSPSLQTLNSTLPLSSTSTPPLISPHAFSFPFPLLSSGPHLLLLHFPSSSPSPLFNLSISSFPLLSNFSPSSPSTTTTKEFLFLNLNLPSLLLSFTPSTSIALTSAYLHSIPPGLIPDQVAGVGLTGHVLEVLHRVNVGGPKVSPVNDTLGRTWVEDDGFLVGRKGETAPGFPERLSYREGGATEEAAPESVYGTCRELGITGNNGIGNAMQY